MEYAELATILELPGLVDHVQLATETASASISDGTDLLADPASRVIDSGGKRLRSLLVVATAGALGADPTSEAVRKAAASVELVHHGSLVHDDIMDGAATRRGVPTVNAAEGPDRALLVGDYMLAKAGRLAADVSQAVAADIALAIEALCTGQVLEEADLHDLGRTVDRAIASIGGKTASLMSTACRVGARCAGDVPEHVAAVSSYGYSFGLSFQLVDDLLDLLADDRRLGKPTGNDIRMGVYAVPLLLALELVEDQTLAELLPMARTDNGARRECLEIVRASGAVERTLVIACRQAGDARDALAELAPDFPGLAGLARLPELYIEWALDGLIPAAPVA